MQQRTTSMVKVFDFMFENSTVKVIANRSCPEIKLGGLTVGPFEEGNEYEVYFWVACELEKFGIVRFRNDELLDTSKLYKIHWKERVQAVGQISELPDNFYPKLRRYLADLRREMAKNPEKMREYEKAWHLALDIINLRFKKIVSIASTPAQSEQVLKNFTNEERFLYERIFKLISEWKTQLLEQEGETA